MGEHTDQARGMAGTQTARGSVRDVLAALQNLEHLLRSPRVGPKSLTQVIHEIRPSCQPIGDVFDRLVDQVAVRVSEPERVRELATFARDRAAQLDEALVRAASSDMGARARLSLEVGVRQLRAELDAVRELLDLLDAATNFCPTELDINALVPHALAVRAPSDPRRPDVARVSFRPCTGCSGIVSDPRVLMPLIAFAVALAARGDRRLVDISASSDGTEGVIMFGPGQASSAEGIACIPPRVVEPTLAVLQVVVGVVGMHFDVSGSERVSLRVPPGHISRSAACAAASLHA